MLVLQRITAYNLELAVSLQHEIFPIPNCDARQNYIDSMSKEENLEYYLIYNNEICVGITGIYQCKSDPDSAWLGWFGIKKEYRQKHFGTGAMKLFEELAIERGYKYARVYTDAIDNDVAIAFYRANGYKSEEYNNEDDPACIDNKVLIFSKSLIQGEVPLWNNRNIYLTEQMEKQSVKD